MKAYVKNHGLNFEVPYRRGSEVHRYLPDFIVQVDDGRPDPLNLVVEIKGFRGEDAKDKKNYMETHWVPGVNNHGGMGAGRSPSLAKCTASNRISESASRPSSPR